MWRAPAIGSAVLRAFQPQVAQLGRILAVQSASIFSASNARANITEGSDSTAQWGLAAAGAVLGALGVAGAGTVLADDSKFYQEAPGWFQGGPEDPVAKKKGPGAEGPEKGPGKRNRQAMYWHGATPIPEDENLYLKESEDGTHDGRGMLIVKQNKSKAPAVPPPCGRSYPVHMVVDITTTTENLNVSPMHKYPFWTFDGTVPGPLIRCRVGDVLEVQYTNNDRDGIGHNIDFHAVTGPGGGAERLNAEAGETKVATFKMMQPGLFMYHCAAAPVPTHIAMGMYGAVLVEPEGGLPPVDKEFYVVQSEIYAEETETRGLLDHSYSEGLIEHPMYVVFNGAEGALTEKGPLVADQGDRVRIYFLNAGPNLVSSFHVIGTIFDKVYREGDLISPPARGIQTTLVPAGGTTVVEMDLPVAGNYTLVDHSIFRMDKGAIGFLKVRAKGDDKRRDIFDSADPASPCQGCKLHN